MDETQSLSVAFDPYAVAAFAGYLILLISIGAYSSRFSSRGISEYFIGGRKINRFVVILLLSCFSFFITPDAFETSPKKETVLLFPIFLLNGLMIEMDIYASLLSSSFFFS
jgi:Na+/proline symporter